MEADRQPDPVRVPAASDPGKLASSGDAAEGAAELVAAGGGPGPPVPSGRIGRARAKVAVSRHRVDDANQRLQESRSRVATVDVVFSVQEDDRDAGGSLLGGAIAFRLFLWLLPASLLVVAGLGFGSASDPTTPGQIARSAGFTSIAAESVNQAASESQNARWLALVLGAWFLYFASVSLLKAMFVAHALVWEVPVPKIEHKPRMVGELLLACLIIAAASSVSTVIRSHSSGYGLLRDVVGRRDLRGRLVGLLDALTARRRLHARAAPGAVLVGVGAQIFHLVAVYLPGRQADPRLFAVRDSGGSAALLSGFASLIGRLIIAAAVSTASVGSRAPHSRRAPGPPRDPLRRSRLSRRLQSQRPRAVADALSGLGASPSRLFRGQRP